MTRNEILAEVARLHLEWTNRVAAEVPTNAADQKPTGRTDYPEHHHDISATPSQERTYLLALANLIGQQDGPVENEDRAQKHDIAEAGHDYWVHGKGLAKWADTDDPWTELHAHLVKFMPDGEAKRTAAEWFHEVFHFWPGSDANRVTHGHPPRGKKVGPG